MVKYTTQVNMLTHTVPCVYTAHLHTHFRDAASPHRTTKSIARGEGARLAYTKPQHHVKPAVGAHTCDPSAQEAEVGGSGVQGYP